MTSLVPQRQRGIASRIPDPIEWMDRFFNEFVPSRLMGRMVGPLWYDDQQNDLMPAFDVSETEDHIEVRADLPGIDTKNLNISLSGNILSVRGERKEERTEENDMYHSVERRFGSFSRSFTLPADVKEEGIEAAYKDGVLSISIPKAETVRQRRIEVKSE